MSACNEVYVGVALEQTTQDRDREWALQGVSGIGAFEYRCRQKLTDACGVFRLACCFKFEIQLVARWALECESLNVGRPS